MHRFKLVIFALLLSTNVYALEGVDYVTFNINGKTYDAPIPNKETRQQFRELKEVLNGNELSREFLLGGKSEKYIFIGDIGVVRWVKLTNDNIEVIEYTQGERRDG